MSRTRPRLTVIAAAVIGALVSTATPAIAAEGDLVYQATTADYDLRVVETTDATMWDVEVTNLSGAPIHFGLGATTHDPTTVEYLWNSPWEYFGEETEQLVQPGQTYVHYLPAWPGADLVFFRDIDTVPVEVGRYRAPGSFTPFIVSGNETDGLSIEWGPYLSVGSGAARAGEVVHLAASWIAVSAADIYVIPIAQAHELALSDPQTSIADIWDVPPGASPVASVAVSGSALSADALLPATLAPGEYAVIAIDPVTTASVAGPYFQSGDALYTGNVTIEPGSPRGTVLASPNPVTVTPVDQYGNSPATFTFADVAVPGEVTVTTSTTGPTPAGFTLAGTYYEISSTAESNSGITVCISYDTSGWVESDNLWQALALFHYEDSAWQDITVSRTFGQVCGLTESFSPFAIGTPTPAPVVWPFEGFLAPVSNTALNTEFAGLVVPFRFRLGGDRGLEVLDGAPSVQRVNCVTRAPIGAPVAASSAVRTQLTYVKGSKTYWYFWDTKTSWANTCQTFTMKLDDGTSHAATFSFKKLSIGALIRTILKAF